MTSRSPLISISDGPELAPAGMPHQGILPGPVWKYSVPGGTSTGEFTTRFDWVAGVVSAGQVLRYAVFPVLDRSVDDVTEAYRATAVALDLVFDDGRRLSDSSPRDQHGVALTARDQYESKTVAADQWTVKTVALDDFVGRTIVAAEVSVWLESDVEVSGYVNGLAVVPAPSDREALDHVRTTRGSHSTGAYSRGNTSPLVAVPHGAVFGVPVTDAASPEFPYLWAGHNRPDARPSLQAVATSHIPSPWIRDRGVFQIMPSVDPEPNLDKDARALGFDHADEEDRPHLYRVDVDGGIRVELTAARFSLFVRTTFPDETGTLIFDQLDANGGLDLSRAVTDGIITAFVDGAGDSPRMFVWATVDRLVTSAREDGARGRISLTLGASKDVTIRVGTSFLSVDQARHNLELDAPDDDSFETVAERARELWASNLDVVTVDGATHDQLVTLYSSLYRLFLYPNESHENIGEAAAPQWRYASPFQPLREPHSATETACVIRSGVLSVNNGFWDTYRTVWPALLLLMPETAGELIDGFLQHYRDAGWTSRWSAPGAVDTMTGTTTDVIFADAAVLGTTAIDLLAAYDSALHNAVVASPQDIYGRKGVKSQTFRGFTDAGIPEGMSWTLDSVLNDTAIAEFAEALRHTLPAGHERLSELEADAVYYRARGARYTTVFDARIGFFQGRNPDGQWRVENADEYDPRVWGNDYTETNGWGTAFSLPHDGAGLAWLHGGARRLESKLDEFFSVAETGREEFSGSYATAIHEMAEARDVRMGMLGLSNQPAHHIPFMYAFTGAHSKTQRIVREAARRLFLGSEIGQGYPGDEDNGEMSAWYLFAMLGLYPLVPASGEFVITTPLHRLVIVKLPNGRELRVSTVGDLAHDYIGAVTIDGAPWDSVTVPRARLLEGASIVVELSSHPTAWAAASTPSSLTPLGEAPRPRLDLTEPGGAGPLFDDVGEVAIELRDGASVEYAFSAPVTTSLYTVTLDTTDDASWQLEGSLDGVTWSVIDSRAGETFRWSGHTRPFVIASPGEFDRYRLVALSPLAISQIELLAD